MPKVTSISVEAAITLNLGNYQSAKVSAGATLEIMEGDNIKNVYKQAYDMVTSEIDKQQDEIKGVVNGEKKSGQTRGLSK